MNNEGTIDPMTVEFVDYLTNKISASVSNWTSYSIERDFFFGPDSFVLTCEDDRADQLLNSIAVGMGVNFKINNSTVLKAFIDSIDIDPTRGGRGKQVVIRGRDALGFLSDASIYPNLGSQQITTTFQFKATDTLAHVLQTIFANAPLITTLMIDQDAAALTAANGFGIGIRAKGKTGRGISKSFQTNLSHLLKPEKGETFLAYAQRIATRAGCYIKMQQGTNDTIYVGPPVYDRNPFNGSGVNGSGDMQPLISSSGGSDSSSAPYSLIRNTTNDTLNNNVLSGRISVSYRRQPSVIIAEGSHGGPTFKKVTHKIICINEITGYVRTNGNTSTPTLSNAINSVQDSIKTLTAGTTSYTLLKSNADLWHTIQNLGSIGNMTTYISRPEYVVDYNSQTDDELIVYVSERMAHYQDEYLTMEYEVEGHTTPINFSDETGVWAPNLTCEVHDQAYHPTNSLDGVFWISKVQYTRDRSNGVRTRLTLKLPNTHLYTLTIDQNSIQLDNATTHSPTSTDYFVGGGGQFNGSGGQGDLD